MGVEVSSSHVISAAPSSSGGGLFTLCPCPSVRSLSRETVLHKLLQCESFPWAAALHELPQCGSFPRGAVLQEQAAPAWVPHRVKASFRHPPARAWGPFHGLQVEICSTVDLCGLQGDNLASPWSFITGCKGRLSALTSGAPPPSPSSLTLVSAELFLSHSLTPLA